MSLLGKGLNFANLPKDIILTLLVTCQHLSYCIEDWISNFDIFCMKARWQDVVFSSYKKTSNFSSIFHFVHAIARAHASTCATSLMCVKNSMRHFCQWHWDSGTKKMKERTKTKIQQLTIFLKPLLTFCQLECCTSMCDLRIRENSQFRVNTIISLAYINLPMYPCILQPWQVNLSNPEAYSDPCQISKMEFFRKIVNGYNRLIFFVKHSILDI